MCIPIKDDTVAKTEPRIKRENIIGYIRCRVHVLKWPVGKDKHIRMKPRICVGLLFVTHLINHLVWPHQPENPPGRPMSDFGGECKFISSAVDTNDVVTSARLAA